MILYTVKKSVLINTQHIKIFALIIFIGYNVFAVYTHTTTHVD